MLQMHLYLLGMPQQTYSDDLQRGRVRANEIRAEPLDLWMEQRPRTLKGGENLSKS